MSLMLTPEARALWHLELLGCYAPEDAEPQAPEVQRQPVYYDDDHDGRYLGESLGCWACGGEGIEVICCDDICHGLGYCMHGDGDRPCPECGGEGWLS